MRATTAMIAALGVLGVMNVAAPARADDDDFDAGWRRHKWQEHQWREQRWREHEWREHAWQSYTPRPTYVMPGYYAAQPSYYVPPPAYYVPAPPPPGLSFNAAPGVSIGFSFR